MTLHYATIGDPAVFDNAPVTMLFAVFDSLLGTQKHANGVGKIPLPFNNLSRHYSRLRQPAVNENNTLPASTSLNRRESRLNSRSRARCLYEVAKFDSDSERLFSVMVEIDPDVHKWFGPAKGQFQLFYKSGVDHREYQPDFVVETQGAIYMCEPKQRKELEDSELLAKKEAAERWCARATAHTATYGGKPWRYALIPHDAIAANMSLRRLAQAV